MKLSLRRSSQVFFLTLFLYLFIATEYRGKEEIFFGINSFFKANPLLALSYIFSAKTVSLIVLPAIILLVATFFLGRFFCGWICPLGTIIDLFSKFMLKKKLLTFLKGPLKYYVLFALLFTAVFGINISGLVDPIAILTRALAFFLYPLFGYSLREMWKGLYRILGEKIDIFELPYGIIRDYLMPFRDTFYPLAFLSIIFLFFIIFLERYEKRNWCRNLCPLGTLLGFFSRFSLFKRRPIRLCEDCKKCEELCASAFEDEIFVEENCILCMECTKKCEKKRARFILGLRSKMYEDSYSLQSRRFFIISLFSGLFLSKVFTFVHPQKTSLLLRPPGVKSEREFLKKCVRCGACIKVCLKNALYPLFLEAGFYGIFTPHIIPRLGYCEYSCNLCGQVCPTGAIPNLPIEEKRKSIIGLAVIDKNRCLPYARGIDCIVCEEHCPIPEKAIRFEEDTRINDKGERISLKRPYIVEELCNGCGICENKCPLEGESAIRIFAIRRR